MNPESSPSEMANRAQAFLFAEGGTLPLKKLSQLIQADYDHTSAALDELTVKLQGTGLCIIRSGAEVTLAVAPQESEALRANYEKELGREVGDAGLEVLAIILYRGPSTRAEIDYIRGVNTSSTVRTLLARGLIERVSNPADGREYVYQATTELLAHLGARERKELPDYGRISSELQAFEAAEKDNDSNVFTTTYDRNTTDTDGRTTVADDNTNNRAGNDETDSGE